MKSFYDLDFIIEMNEKRLEQYDNSYQKILEKFTHLLIVYSAQTIFLAPIVQSLFFSGVRYHWVYYAAFFIYCGLLLLSIYHAIYLLTPVFLPGLKEPKFYYTKMMEKYKAEGVAKEEADKLIKSSYIRELERVIVLNIIRFRHKEHHYSKAFVFSLLSCIPFLLCLGFYLSANENGKIASNSCIHSDTFIQYNNVL